MFIKKSNCNRPNDCTHTRTEPPDKLDASQREIEFIGQVLNRITWIRIRIDIGKIWSKQKYTRERTYAPTYFWASHPRGIIT